ncbi:MAG: hypothetical protein BWK80_63185 [Desulfobacteraceae bacterium IS3]|nr:MAG: hypothetical protein BWK80_63185 [Desulfobacteraceae bacterium IS3]
MGSGVLGFDVIAAAGPGGAEDGADEDVLSAALSAGRSGGPGAAGRGAVADAPASDDDGDDGGAGAVADAPASDDDGDDGDDGAVADAPASDDDGDDGGAEALTAISVPPVPGGIDVASKLTVR